MVLGMGTDQKVRENRPHPCHSPRPAAGMVIGVGPACFCPGRRAHGGVEADASAIQESINDGPVGTRITMKFRIDRAADHERTLGAKGQELGCHGSRAWVGVHQLADHIGVQGGDQTRSSSPLGPIRKT